MLQHHVKDIALGISKDQPERAEYLRLAEEFRMPYWDWASQDTQIVPQIALDRDYREKGPGSSASVTAKGFEDYNPLFEYPFPEDTPDDIRVSAFCTSEVFTIRSQTHF